MDTALASEVARFIDGSIIALGNLTPIELTLAVTEAILGLAALAIPRMITRRQPSEVEAKVDYDEAA